MPIHVFTDEIVDNGGLKDFPLVGHDMGDAQTTTQITGIVQILRIAILFIKAEGDTGHFISGIHQEQGSYRAVRTPTQSQQNFAIFFHGNKNKGKSLKLVLSTVFWSLLTLLLISFTALMSMYYYDRIVMFFAPRGKLMFFIILGVACTISLASLVTALKSLHRANVEQKRYVELTKKENELDKLLKVSAKMKLVPFTDVKTRQEIDWAKKKKG